MFVKYVCERTTVLAKHKGPFFHYQLNRECVNPKSESQIFLVCTSSDRSAILDLDQGTFSTSPGGTICFCQTLMGVHAAQIYLKVSLIFVALVGKIKCALACKSGCGNVKQTMFYCVAMKKSPL